MDELWACVEQLSGRTLTTTGTAEPFDVVAVDDSGVTFRPHSSTTGKDYRVPRQEIEEAYRLKLEGGAVSPGAIRKAGVSERHPAYVAAILKECGDLVGGEG